jgi:hypothetical protein
MTDKPAIPKEAIYAELAIIRARMQAIETTLPAGKCALWECDALYGKQEDLKDLLFLMGENTDE